MNKLDFPTTEKYSKNDILRVQSILLKMAKEVHMIFKDNNIKYFITFGTLLGAVRHNGFIPWDDDFDIFIFDEDYDRSIQLLKEKLSRWIIVHNKKSDPIYWPAWSKLRDINSETYATLFPDDNNYKYTGINLDLFRLKKMARKNVNKYIVKENIYFYFRKFKSGLIKRKVVAKNILRLLPIYIKESIESFISNDNDKIYSSIIMLKSVELNSIFPLKKYKFENYEFWGPNDAHMILTTVYGDYMKIPEYEKRKPHYAWVNFKNNQMK